jgi:hypothetical protein
VIELSPDVEKPGYRTWRAALLLKSGQVTDAVAEVDALTSSAKELDGLDHLKPDDWYSAACVYAVASASSTEQGPECADRAIEMLKEAVADGFTDLDWMSSDRDLDPLREREDFQELMEVLKRTNAESP